MAKPRHCDDYIDDPSAPASLRALLKAARGPSQSAWLGGLPPLFATLKRDFAARDGDGVIPLLRVGQRARVVMASKFGDVGITLALVNERDYVARAAIHERSVFRYAERCCLIV
jgi:hypothetical protein